MGKYWDIEHILPYQRPFNFITGIRGMGKTYSTQKWLLKQALTKGRETGYITRTIREQSNNGLLHAWEKVLKREYPAVEYTIEDGCLVCDGKICVRPLALSQAIKLKKISYPNIYYFLFDEYQIEKGTGEYLRGFNEPVLFITIYHTIDREENRVKCFFMGNNTSYYNPYHMYPVFGLPKDPRELSKKKIWTNKVTLFEGAEPSAELLEAKSSNLFIQSLEGTRYGDYASHGKYLDDEYTNLSTVDPNARQIAIVRSEGENFGLYNNALKMEFIFTGKYDPSCRWRVSLDKEDIKGGYSYIKNASSVIREALKRMYHLGGVSYDSMVTKAKIEPKLILLL